MKILITFALFTISSYANNIHLKNPQHGCNYFRKAAIGEPSVLWNFNFMNPYENFSLEDISEEIWKDVPFMHGYMVSNKGRVKSIDRTIRYKNGVNARATGRIIRQWINHKGYCMVSLKAHNIRKHFSVHRLLLRVFVGESHFVIDHIDSNPKNNCIENLEYVTHRENTHRYFKKVLTMPLGVRKRSTGRYQAELRIKGRLYVLGNYDTIEEAVSIHTKALNDLDNIHLYAKVGPKRKPK